MSQLESFWIASRRLKTKTGSQTASCGLRQNEPKNWRPPWINWRKDHPAILDRLNTIINDLGPAAPKRELHWSDQGKKDWCEFYNSIKSSGSGVVGAIVARTDAHVLRLTMHFTVRRLCPYGAATPQSRHCVLAVLRAIRFLDLWPENRRQGRG
jgi:hypothetical protein